MFWNLKPYADAGTTIMSSQIFTAQAHKSAIDTRLSSSRTIETTNHQ